MEEAEEVEKKKPTEGTPAAAGGGGGGSGDKAKRKMKTAYQLDLLEKTYAVDTYPSESVRAELSVKLGLTDRQLQMWFCHRRLKDRKTPPTKRPRKDSAASASAAVTADEAAGSGESPFGSDGGGGERGKAIVSRGSNMVSRIGVDVMVQPPLVKRYYEPPPPTPQSILELRAIAFVESQLGERLREDGPILGIEFDPLPPGAFGAPIVTPRPKQTIQPYDGKIYDRHDTKPIKTSAYLPSMEHSFVPASYSGKRKPSIGNAHVSHSQLVSRAPHEYQFLPEQPSVRSDAYEMVSQSHFYDSPADAPGIKSSPIPSGGTFLHGNESYPFQGQASNASPVPQQGRQSHFYSRGLVEYENISHKNAFANIGADAQYGNHSITGLEIVSSERQMLHEDDASRTERKRKNEEARIQKEVEAHEKRIRKELERQDILRRKREEQMRREMERHDRERRKEEDRLLREKQREEERFQREQRREIERRERFMQKESLRAEKRRLKEEHRREKEAARVKAANERAAARRMAREYMELIEDDRLELMELSALSKSLPSITALDSDSLQQLELFRDMLTAFPPKSVKMKKPFAIQPWSDSEENVGNLLMDPRLLGEIHVALLKSIIKDIEDVARTPAIALGANQNSAANPGGGHPQIVEGGNDGEDIISTLRNGSAAENAVALMQVKGFPHLRRSRHRLTPGTVKFAAFHVLSLEGSHGLTILDVAEKIQKSGLRDLTTSKTPEASIAAALSRDTKLFERTAPSTYCVRSPYRKDPADAEAILAAAREKIQIFENGLSESEEAEKDIEDADDVERDDDSECDVADDPEVDDGGTVSNSKLENVCVHDLKVCDAPTCSRNGKGKVLHDEGGETPENRLGNGEKDFSSPSENPKNHPSIVSQNHEGNVDFEDTEIDESSSGEAWVQGLMEGEYSDLNVEERLNALVALIGIAIEGNSIRVILEERLDAANALKKQMWAEAQLDKRRMKEEYLTKIQYPSIAGGKSETNLMSASAEGDHKGIELNASPSLKHEQFTDSQNPTYLNNTPTEKNLLSQDLVSPDVLQCQQYGYQAEKSRSQMKSLISHKAEEMFVYRSLPLGQDRRRNRYWQFVTSASRNDPGSGRIFFESQQHGYWRLIDSAEAFDNLLAALDTRGIRESHLHSMLQKIETLFKESVRKNLQLTNTSKSRTEVAVAPSPDCTASYLSEDKHCPSCHKTFKTFQNSDGNYNGHVVRCEEKRTDLKFHSSEPSLPMRMRMVKSLLAFMEVSIPPEALQSFWTGGYRKSWAVKLHSSSSAEDLFQILTLLEGAIKRDFLSPNFETTKELLSSSKPGNPIDQSGILSGSVPMLPWVPQTTGAVALRLMELDASIYYIVQQKLESQKEEGGDYLKFPSRYTVKNLHEPDPTDVPDRLDYHPQDTWPDLGMIVPSFGRGRGSSRGRGGRRGRGRGSGRGQRGLSIIGSEHRRLTTVMGEKTPRGPSRVGRPRGRGGRKRGRRSVRPRPKVVNKIVIKEPVLPGFGNMGVLKQNVIAQPYVKETRRPMFAEENNSASVSSESDEDAQMSGDEYEEREYAGLYLVEVMMGVVALHSFIQELGASSFMSKISWVGGKSCDVVKEWFIYGYDVILYRTAAAALNGMPLWNQTKRWGAVR
ncbi:hypothetical protein QJS04_geneDACA022461 [Acorus gramineus]|uniref:Uncharacterized protein n=1 Tax=Acorus gramineus TaxID=55184 RepID=A0AAV9BJ39_ACOGR|nr:hypothetical protein QJS04_geneDACA022461 [Acorus gramineus]